jgi:probable rRNA maturation factor
VKPRLRFDVQHAVSARNLPSRTQLRKWAHAGLEHEAKITIRIVGQTEGRALNRNFRGKDHATNVLTFVFRDEPPFEGDLALCAPVIAREAREQGKSIAAHYAHLVVHGVLHLQGYDHENDADARIMEKRESQIVGSLGFADPYEKDEGGRTKTKG